MTRAFAYAREGLPKHYRLLRPADFSTVLRHGRKTRDRMFAVFAKPNGLPHVRIGLVVSRKVSFKAVVRNRVKRHMRESARRHHDTLKGVDLVVIAQGPAAAAEPAELRTSLERHWISIIEQCRDS